MDVIFIFWVLEQGGGVVPALNLVGGRVPRLPPRVNVYGSHFKVSAFSIIFIRKLRWTLHSRPISANLKTMEQRGLQRPAEKKTKLFTDTEVARYTDAVQHCLIISSTIC